MAGLFSFLFSFEEPIERIHWWLLQLIGCGFIFFEGLLTGLGILKQSSLVGFLLLMFSFVIGIWILLASDIRRFHAFDKSGWNCLWLLFPFFGPLYVLYVCGIKSE